MVETENYNREIITNENKSLTIFLMLLYRQRVDYDTIFDIYGCSNRTLNRIIATIRDSMEIIGFEGQIVYDKRTKSYMLIIVSRK